MFTSFDKAIAAFLSSLIFIIGTWYAPALGLQGIVEPIAEGEAIATKRLLGVLTDEVDDAARRADAARAGGVPNLRQRD
jgi:ABC-type transport system involved in cytochrome c biogenesis permease subunit